MWLTDIPVYAGKAKESEGYFLCSSPQLEQPCTPPKHRSSCEDQRLTQDSINPPFHVPLVPPSLKTYSWHLILWWNRRKKTWQGLSVEWRQQHGSSSLGDNGLSLGVSRTPKLKISLNKARRSLTNCGSWKVTAAGPPPSHIHKMAAFFKHAESLWQILRAFFSCSYLN